MHLILRCFPFLLLLLCAHPLAAQFGSSIVTTLEGTVSETSGLAFVQGRLLTHNDSGDGPRIYEVDSSSGAVTRTVFVANAGASDWEDIAADSAFLYIADFGNNAGNRTDLAIYRVSWADYFASDTVLADTIRFSYADQSDFSNQTFQTNFDAEALVALGDSLYVFTKNWGNFQTNVYPLPKAPGTYSLVKRDSILCQGLVTGADYDPATGSIWLLGYLFTNQFLVEIPNAGAGAFSSGAVRHVFSASPAIQVEGICAVDGVEWLVSAEAGQGANVAHLYRFSIPTVSRPRGRGAVEPRAYPNPAGDRIRVEAGGVEVYGVHWFDVSGRLIGYTPGSVAEVAGWAPGTYIARPFDLEGDGLGQVRVVLLH